MRDLDGSSRYAYTKNVFRIGFDLTNKCQVGNLMAEFLSEKLAIGCETCGGMGWN